MIVIVVVSPGTNGKTHDENCHLFECASAFEIEACFVYAFPFGCFVRFGSLVCCHLTTRMKERARERVPQQAKMSEQEVKPTVKWEKICHGFFMLVKYALKIRVDEQNEAFQESNLTTSLFFIVDIVVVFFTVVVVVVFFSFLHCNSSLLSFSLVLFSLLSSSYFNFERPKHEYKPWMTFVHRICTVIAAMNIIINTHARTHASICIALTFSRKEVNPTFFRSSCYLLCSCTQFNYTQFVMTSICFRAVFCFSSIFGEIV